MMRRYHLGRLVIVALAVCILMGNGTVWAEKAENAEAGYPALTYTWFQGGVLISVEGVRYREAAGFTWNGEDISDAVRSGIENGLIEFRRTPHGFELVVNEAPELFGLVGDGLFGVVLPTGASVTVPMALNTLRETTASSSEAVVSKAVTQGCPWLTFGRPTVLSANKSCGYGSTNCYKAGWYHTGIDYSGSGNVLAAADGVVARVEYKSSGDHGMGNNVIIRHTLSNCSSIYSTYSHMGSIDSMIKTGAKVSRGQKLGTIGGSGYGNSSYWSKHLHFEMKTSPVTGSPYNGAYWGYTPKYPDNYGYKNPGDYIGK